jgi:hypothetical protein
MDNPEHLSALEQKRQKVLTDLANLRRQVAEMSPEAVERWTGFLEEAGMTQREAQQYVRGLLHVEPGVALEDSGPDRGAFEVQDPTAHA